MSTINSSPNIERISIKFGESLSTNKAGMNVTIAIIGSTIQSSMFLLPLHGAKPHDVSDARPIVPAAIEDHDLACGRELLKITLHEHLRFLLLALGERL